MVIDSKPHTYALNGEFVCLYLLYGSNEKGMGWKGQGIIYGDANSYTDAHHTCNIVIYIYTSLSKSLCGCNSNAPFTQQVNRGEESMHGN